MRIIAGRAKGTRLSDLKGLKLRPTLDRVKESLFNQLAPTLVEANVLDLFAGTGAIGLEALSRNAKHVVFVEPNREIRNLLLANLVKCKFPETDWTLIATDAHQALNRVQEESCKFDVIYLDPPFADQLYQPTLELLSSGDLLSPEGQVIAEHHPKESLDSNYGRLSLIKSRKLGDSVLTFYQIS